MIRAMEVVQVVIGFCAVFGAVRSLVLGKQIDKLKARLDERGRG